MSKPRERMSKPRERQLAYSTLQAKMLDEDLRRSKGAKIRAVVEHFLGIESLSASRRWQSSVCDCPSRSMR